MLNSEMRFECNTQQNKCQIGRQQCQVSPSMYLREPHAQIKKSGAWVCNYSAECGGCFFSTIDCVSRSSFKYQICTFIERAFLNSERHCVERVCVQHMQSKAHHHGGNGTRSDSKVQGPNRRTCWHSRAVRQTSIRRRF